MRVSIIAAIAGENRAIGKDNALLWHIPEDMRRFKELTTGHMVIMGQKTFESIGRPLPNRTNVILSRDTALTVPGCTVVHSIDEAIAEAKKVGETEMFIIGGGQIYQAFIPYADRLYLTLVSGTYADADTFFPAYDDFKTVVESVEREDGEYRYAFQVLEK